MLGTGNATIFTTSHVFSFLMLPVICAVYTIFPLQDHGSVRLGCPGHWQVCPGVFQRHFPHHHVWGAAQRGSHPQAVHRHLPGPGDRRAGPGGGNVLQTHLPIPLSRDHDQVDQGENSVRKEDGTIVNEGGRVAPSEKVLSVWAAVPRSGCVPFIQAVGNTCSICKLAVSIIYV